MNRELSRRAFLVMASAAAAACASSGRRASPSSSSELSILNWESYIDDQTIDLFSRSSRLRVSYDADYTGNDEMFSERFEPTRGRIGYDVVMPTFWLAGRLAARGWIQDLPLEHLPNHVNVDPAFLVLPWDRGGHLHMPWQVGITGIAYNPALTRREITSLTDLFDPAFKGKVGMVQELRETLALAMLVDGADPSRPTQQAAEQALARLEQAKSSGQIAEFTGGEFKDRLKSGAFALCLAWSGDIVQLQKERPDIRFVVPTEGAMQWFDTMVIPVGAENAVGAAKFMNFVYDPLNAARITESVQYISPVMGVRDVLKSLGGESALLASNPILFPDESIKRRLFTWGGLSEDVEAALETRFRKLVG